MAASARIHIAGRMYQKFKPYPCTDRCICSTATDLNARGFGCKGRSQMKGRPCLAWGGRIFPVGDPSCSRNENSSIMNIPRVTNPTAVFSAPWPLAMLGKLEESPGLSNPDKIRSKYLLRLSSPLADQFTAPLSNASAGDHLRFLDISGGSESTKLVS